MRRYLDITVLFLASLPLSADTMEFIRGGKIHGAVTLKNDQFTLKAAFAQGGVREVVIDRKYVAAVEINARRENEGAAPADFGKFSEGDAERFELQTADVLRYTDGERARGRLKEISEGTVVFNEVEAARAEVVEVLLGSAKLFR